MSLHRVLSILLTKSKRKIEHYYIYLSHIDLEHDLVHSNLFTSLKNFYNTQNEKQTVDKMQKAKAENMLEFLKIILMN